MNGDDIFDKKTGETYEEHGIRIRDERISMLENQNLKLLQVLKAARDVIENHDCYLARLDNAVESCSDIEVSE